MLTHRAKLQAGEHVLVVGSGGGVNSISIQLAKCLGAKVVALAGGPEKAARAKELGADAVIDYQAFPNWVRLVREQTGGQGADVIVDNVGAKTLQFSLQAAARGGRIVTVGNTSGPLAEIDNRFIFAKQLSLIGSTMGSRNDFTTVLAMLEKSALKPVIDQVLPLEQGVSGYRRLLSGNQFGKIVLLPDQ